MPHSGLNPLEELLQLAEVLPPEELHLHEEPKPGAADSVQPVAADNADRRSRRNTKP
jgi:hypothetical protein